MIIQELKEFQVEIEKLFKEHFDLDFNINFKPCLENDLLKTDILVNLAKKLRCSPKEIFSKISNNNLSWSCREEQGFLYVKPKRPISFSAVNIDVEGLLAAKLTEYYFIPNAELQEITLLRVKALFYILFKLREIFGLKTILYLPNSISSFTKVSSLAELKNCNFRSLSFFTKNDEEILIDSNNLSQKIVFSVKDGCNVAYNLGAKLGADSVFIPRCFLSKHDFIDEIPFLESSFNESPESSSFYLCKDITNNDIDTFVINSNEQVNILALAKSTYSLLSNVNFSNLTPINNEQCSKEQCSNEQCSDSEFELHLAAHRVVLFLERAISNGNAYEFTASINNYLVLFQKFYNSPKIRQKIAENQLSYYELSIITSVFELLKLCHTNLGTF